MKLAGALLVLLAAGYGCVGWIAGRRQEIRRVGEMAAALERMAGMIRWQLLPLPRVLEVESRRDSCGAELGKVLELMQGKTALQNAWISVFSDFQPAEAAEILGRLSWDGDMLQVTGGLSLAAQQLRAVSEQMAAQQGTKERLCVALGGGAAAIAVIILI